MNKKNSYQKEYDNLKGFEDLIGESLKDSNSSSKSNRRDVSFELLTFLKNDSLRLTKLNDLLTEKIPFTVKYQQGNKLVEEQKKDIEIIKNKLFDNCLRKDSAYRLSLSEIFNEFFSPPKN